MSDKNLCWQGMTRQDPASGGRQPPRADSLRGMIRHRLKHLSTLSSPSACIAEDQEMGRAMEPISRYETSPPKEQRDAGKGPILYIEIQNFCYEGMQHACCPMPEHAAVASAAARRCLLPVCLFAALCLLWGVNCSLNRRMHAARQAPRILPWWASDCDVPDGLEGQLIVGKPSVFFRKTIKTTAADGTTVAVNAQQYAVLVMDVPDLRARRAAIHATPPHHHCSP